MARIPPSVAINCKNSSQRARLAGVKRKLNISTHTNVDKTINVMYTGLVP